MKNEIKEFLQSERYRKSYHVELPKGRSFTASTNDADRALDAIQSGFPVKDEYGRRHWAISEKTQKNIIDLLTKLSKR